MTGEELKTIRTEHDLTQRALGELLGYNANYIMRLERGHADITARFERLVRNMLGQKRKKKSSQTI